MKKSNLSFVRSSRTGRKLRRMRFAGTAGAVLCVLIGGAIAIARYSSSLEQWVRWHPSLDGTLLEQLIGWIQPQSEVRANNSRSAVLPLVSLPPEQRLEQLQALAQAPKSQDRARARYLLASDLIQQRQGEKALSALQGLDQEYPDLAAYVALRRAQAYELTDRRAAAAAWQELLKRSTLWYSGKPDNPVAAEALYVLGRNESKYWDQAIAQFPSHPRTVEIARERLQQNSRQPQLLLLLAKYADDGPEITPVLNRLVRQSASQLKPEDWEAIAFRYWENREYDQAAIAYDNAPHNPFNAYRIARGRQLSNRPVDAAAAYLRLLNKYPAAKETGNGLLQLQKLERQTEAALSYVDLAINRFPDQAGEALLKRAALVEHLNNPKSKDEALRALLTRYGDSDAAAEYRWKVAQERAAVKDYAGAVTWVQPIPQQNPNSSLAPRATFWLGKWAKRLGRLGDAKSAFEHVLAHYPQSYYAWRSAGILGLDVGNFNTVRQLTPGVVQPNQRPMPPTGSATFKELYQLGQDSDAWSLWQVEFQHRTQPTVAEQFTEGLLHLSRGENLVGISDISTLEDRNTPEEKTQYRDLKQQPAYWQALYPFPYFKEIKTWSQKRQINPLLVAAVVRQESRFEPKIRSGAGAVGLIQLIPETAKWVAEQNNLKRYNIEDPNDNLRLGTWFLNFSLRKYNDNSLLAVASYNAGPSNVSKWLEKFGKNDPDEFIEAIPFDETKDYVRQVFSNYWNYLRLYNPQTSQLVAKYVKN